MGGYLLQRAWGAVLVLLAVSLLSFLLILLSGDPVAVLVPLNSRQEDMANIRRRYNLDQPIPVQYLLFLERVTQGRPGRIVPFTASPCISKEHSAKLGLRRQPTGQAVSPWSMQAARE